MAKDFRSDQIRTRQIIGSGSIPGAPSSVGLVIYSGSKASNYDGTIDGSAAFWADVGSDVWLVISGGTNNTAYQGGQRVAGTGVLFKGDVIISGSLFAERSVIEVDSSVQGDLIVPNRAALGTSADNAGPPWDLVGTGSAMVLADPYTPDGSTAPGKGGSQGTVSFKKVGPFKGTYQYNRTFPSTFRDVFFHVSGSRGVRGTNDRGLALFDGDVHVSGNMSMFPGASWTTDVILDNGTGDPPVFRQQNTAGNRFTELDVQQGRHDLSDLRYHVQLANSASDPGSGIKFKVRASYPWAVGGGATSSQFMISGSGAVALDQGKFFYFDTNENIGIGTSGTPKKRVWEFTGGTYPAETYFKSTTVTSSGGFYAPDDGGTPGWRGQSLGYQFRGNHASVGGTDAGVYYNNGAITNPVLFGPMNTLVVTASAANHHMWLGAGEVTISGKDGIFIQSSAPGWTSGGGPIHLLATGSGITMRGDVNIYDNLTVHGGFIKGHVVSASVQDPVLLLNSGSLTSNSGGGIAIASGSHLSATPNYFSLIFGRDVTSVSPLDQFIVGRLNAKDGDVTDFQNAEPVRIRTSGIAIGAVTQILTSSGGAPGVHHLSMSNLTSGGDILIDGRGGATGELVFSGSSFRFERGQEIYIDEVEDVWMRVPSTQDYLMLKLKGGMSLVGPDDGIKFSSSTPGLDRRVIKTQVDIIHGKSRDNLVVTNSGGDVRVSAQKDLVLTGAAPEDTMISLGVGSKDRIGNMFITSSTTFSGGGSGESYIAFGDLPEFIEQEFTTTQYRDVNFYVSGSAGTRNTTNRGVALFSGDVVISGTADIGELVLNNLTLQSTDTNEPYIHFRDSSFRIFRDSTGQLSFKDPIAGSPLTLADLASVSVADNSDVFTVVHANIGNQYLSRVKTSGSFSFDHNYNDSNPNPSGIRTTADVGHDVYFFVSGSSRTGKGTTAPPSVALFEGDLVTSGAMYFEELPAAPDTVGPNTLALYTKDVSGTTKLYWKNAAAEGTFGGSLDDAYDTPDGGGPSATSAGAVINVDGRPVQLQGAMINNHLVITGSHAFIDSSGNSTPPVIRGLTNSSDLKFNVNVSTVDTEVFRLTGGTGNLYVASGKSIAFNPSETNAVLRYLSPDGGSTHAVASKHFIPTNDNQFDLGHPSYRWANIYTGDLHLKNERGDWTIVEESDYLCVINNKTGKKYKMNLTPIEDDE